MATMTIRNFDDKVIQRLRLRAALHGRSMEDEARDILRSSLAVESTRTASLVESIRARIAPLGGIALKLPQRGPVRTPPKLGE